ncbi:hypothetical protein BDN70DRAFT_888441 [Pholiota conissans]|uniref:Uncharacterized protein n=1 Tax=Pholiota conissans TaxID=109636 RepID=A0A9P5YNN2_9AGAR|nr:hypothetical protein BDN70DRAFT_888441 [Pholiota conissans]
MGWTSPWTSSWTSSWTSHPSRTPSPAVNLLSRRLLASILLAHLPRSSSSLVIVLARRQPSHPSLFLVCLVSVACVLFVGSAALRRRLLCRSSAVLLFCRPAILPSDVLASGSRHRSLLGVTFCIAS